MHKIIIILSSILFSISSLKADLPDTVFVKKLGVNKLLFSNDGQNLIALLRNGVIALINPQNGAIIKQHNVGAKSFDFMTDSNFIYFNTDLWINVINWKTGDTLKKFLIGYVDAITITGNRRYFALITHSDTSLFDSQNKQTWRHKGLIQILDINTGYQIKSVGNPFFTSQITGELSGVTYQELKTSPDGLYLTIIKKEEFVGGNPKYTLLVYNTETWELITSDNPIGVWKFSKDNKIIYGNWTGGIQEFSFPDFKLIKNHGYSPFVDYMSTTPNGNYNIVLYNDVFGSHVNILDTNFEKILYHYNLNYIYGNSIGDASFYITASNDFIVTGGGIDMLHIKTNPTDVKETPIDLQTTLYPNPATDYLNIKLYSNQDNSEIELYNIFGEKLLNEQITDSNINLNISQYPPGVYFIKIQTQSGVKVQKFVKE